MQNIYKINCLEKKPEEDTIPEEVEQIMNNEKYMTVFLSPDTSQLYFDLDGTDKFSDEDHVKSLQIFVQAYLEYMYCMNPTLFRKGRKMVQQMANDPEFWNVVKRNAKLHLLKEAEKKKN